MKISHVAERTGLSIYTLRYYEQIGLISAISRDSSGHRAYTEDDVRAIRFVHALRLADMPVADIKRYIELAQQGESTVVDRLQLLEAHRAGVDERIADLQRHLAAIRAKIAHYREYYQAALESQSAD